MYVDMQIYVHNICTHVKYICTYNKYTQWRIEKVVMGGAILNRGGGYGQKTVFWLNCNLKTIANNSDPKKHNRHKLKRRIEYMYALYKNT